MIHETRFAEKLTPYLRQLTEKSQALHKVYVFDPEHEDIPADTERDLLNEKKTSSVFGVVKKYEGQVLVLLSYTCAAHCRYCERQDRVGVGLDAVGRLTNKQIDAVVNSIETDPTIYEVIASGGDPLTHPKGLKYLFERLRDMGHVKVMRIHTRFPLQFPEKVDLNLMEELARVKRAVYLSLHIDHPDELQPECVDLIQKFRSMGYILLSQSVFLKGVNDDVDTLKGLFLRLFELGVRPYYIYHCQEIPTTKRFVMSLEDEIAIMTRLRNELSGLAFPQHVIDIPGASGKVIIPSNHWNADISVVTDFEGQRVNTKDWTKVI
jgi:lysine 2,3-aminomutase